MPATNVPQVPQAQPVVLVPTAPRAVPANQVNQAKTMELAKIAEALAHQYLHLHQAKAHLDHPVRPVVLDQKDHQVLQAVQAKEADKAHPAHQDLLVQLEAMANQVPKAHLEPMPLEEKARKDPKDQTAQSVHPVPKDQTDPQHLAAVVLDNLAHLDHPAHPAQLPNQENKVPKVHQATPAQTLNIVPVHHEAAWSIVAVLSLFFATSIKKSTIWKGREENFIFTSFLFLCDCVAADLMAPHDYDTLFL